MQWMWFNPCLEWSSGVGAQKAAVAVGVNGLEAGQTFIVACAVIYHNLSMLAGSAANNPAIRHAPSSCWT